MPTKKPKPVKAQLPPKPIKIQLAPKSHDDYRAVTDKTWKALVKCAAKDVVVVVDFWAPWCGPCVSMGKSLDKVFASPLFAKLTLLKYNLDDGEVQAEKNHIQAIPSLLIFKNGYLLERLEGAMTIPRLTAVLKPYA